MLCPSLRSANPAKVWFGEVRCDLFSALIVLVYDIKLKLGLVFANHFEYRQIN